MPTRDPSTRAVYLGGHPLFRDAMRAVLGRFGVRISPAASLPEALDLLDAGDTDAGIVDDEGLGEGRALEAVETMVRKATHLKVAYLSASRSPVLPADVIRSGASAYLSKDMPLVELRFALERMLKGQLVVDPAATRTLLGLTGSGRAANGNGQLYLTPVERKVLVLVADGRANKQVAAELGLSPLTVKNHLARIRGKLGAADKAQAVALAIRRGLLD